MTTPSFPSPTPIHALFDVDGVRPNPHFDTRRDFAAADVIFGRDVMSGRYFLVYGRAALERVLDGTGPTTLKTMVIELDQRDEAELKSLLSVVRTTKGQHDYRD